MPFYGFLSFSKRFFLKENVGNRRDSWWSWWFETAFKHANKVVEKGSVVLKRTTCKKALEDGGFPLLVQCFVCSRQISKKEDKVRTCYFRWWTSCVTNEVIDLKFLYDEFEIIY